MRRLALLSAVLAFPAMADPTPADVQGIMQRDFHPRGQATMDRVVQDGLQRVCTETRDRPPADVAKALEADQLKTIVYPEGSLMGDWKRGEAIAQSGRGLTWNDKPGDPAGGSCYGKTRGTGPEVQRYVYGKIYNAKAYNACSQMPRLGASGTLTAAQIKDLVALLLDPASPVNE